MSINLLQQFAPARSRIQVLTDNYQYLLSIIATFVFFSDLPDYLFSAPIVPIVPLPGLSCSAPGALAGAGLPAPKALANQRLARFQAIHIAPLHQNVERRLCLLQAYRYVI